MSLPMHPGRPSLLILGAGGRLGSTLVATALERGHQVRAVIHNNDPLTEQQRRHPALEIVRGDVHDPTSLADAFADIDAVMASLGSAAAPLPDVASTGARTIVKLMARHRLRRVVTVTGSATRLPDERVSVFHAAKRRRMRAGGPGLLVDGDCHLKVLAASDLDWTTLRVPYMTRQPAMAYELTPGAPNPGATLPYRAAAQAMLDVIASTRWNRAAPFAAASDHCIDLERGDNGRVAS